ncbi:ABC transporter B family member 29, chloroplastic [Ricinus communis]|uniref:ABC transporter B family member 29, chloroplastic n=1 Tax=Ricinus communis TaxID=3988 RepID=UPI00201AF1F7|nr:ABC transporter B family member 29, chloroplastic [Ricinus communis]
MPLVQFQLKAPFPLSKTLPFPSNPKRFSNPILNFPSKTLLKPLNCTKLPSFSTCQYPNQSKLQQKQQKPNSISHTFQSLSTIKPYVLSQQKTILLGWLCSVISVLSLSQIVPRIGQFSANIGKIDALRLRNEGVVLAALFLAKLIATFGQHSLLWKAALNAGYEIRVHVFERVLKRELAFFEGGSGVSSGDIAYRITAQAADVSDTLYALLNTVLPSALQLSAMASRMLAISPVLSLISAMVIPCMAFAIACLGERLRKISKKAHLSIATLSAYLNEVLPAILFVKANNGELCESARFQRLAHADLTEHFKKKNMKVLIPQIIQIIYFGALFMLCCGSMVVSCGCFDGCSMVSFVTSLVFLVEPIQDVGKAYNEWKQGEPAIERLFDLTMLKSKVIEKTEAVDLDHVIGDVKFCDVSFRYGDNSSLVLNRLNLHIKAGETIALIGPSGGGKTTLVKLLLHLYDPSSGCILVDNQNINNILLESLRKHVGLVSQDTTLFSGTIAENIGYRDLMMEIDMEKVEMAAKTANADEFIRKLPKGYKTNIGPRGSSLSGGQKQRLAIARALYQDSSILILDEATSALDSRSELLVRQALQRLMENHTVIIIAHRLETVLMAKRVFSLENGKLEELSRSNLFSTAHSNSLSATGLVI